MKFKKINIIFLFLFTVLSSSVFALEDITSVILNSTSLNNVTTDNLTAYPIPLNDSQNYNYTWYKDDVSQAGQTNSTLNSSYTAKGEVWIVEVITDNGTDSGTATNSTPLTILNTAPTQGTPTISVPVDSDVDNETITCSAVNSEDADDDTITLIIKWYANETEQTHLENSSTVGPGNTTLNDQWFCSIQQWDGEDFGLEKNSSNLRCPGNMTGKGVTGAACEVTNCSQLQDMRNALPFNYDVMNNIDCSGFDSGDGLGFYPVGECPDQVSDACYNGNETPYNGTFNGQGYNISNLNINRSSTLQVGLFGFISNNAIIKNIHLRNVTIVGSRNVGALAGQAGVLLNFNTTINNTSVVGGSVNGTASGLTIVGGLVGQNQGVINNSYSNVDVYSTDQDAGGLVGNNFGSDTYDTFIQNSYALGNVFGAVLDAGGLVGENSNGFIDNSYSTGNVTSSSGFNTGGFVGRNTGNITNSYATGNVIGFDSTGGFAGRSSSSINDPTLIDICYSTGTVNGTDEVGGFIATVNGNQSIVQNSYSTGNVFANETKVGGFAGEIRRGIVTNSYSTGNVTGGSDRVGGFAGLLDSGSGVVGGYIALINNSFSTGYILSSTGKVGIFVGENNNSDGGGDSIIENSYYYDYTSNPYNCVGFDVGTSSGCTGKELISYFQGNVFPDNAPMSSWDFANIWGEVLNEYPKLQFHSVTTDVFADGGGSSSFSGNITSEEPTEVALAFCPEETLLQKIFSTCEIPNNGVCDPNENFLNDKDCTITQQTFLERLLHSIFILRLLLLATAITAIRYKERLPGMVTITLIYLIINMA